MRSALPWLALGCLALSACSADVGGAGAPLEDAEQPIVRATSNGGKDQVVLLYMLTLANGSLGARSCSGTLIAPRVVLTAAHCLSNVWGNQLFAYFGDDFNTDFAKLSRVGQTIMVPAPGQPSKFAQADSYEVHPSWTPARGDGDLAVVYLDRKPPYAPLPLMHGGVNNSWIGKDATLVGWGASQALSADISQTSGGHTQRTGKAKILGTPTSADYHADDPNPAMLLPEIRAHYLKTDGRAPNANTCAGDSGGPLLLNANGQDSVAGVSSWTGLWCEEYSLFTRIDAFRPFLDSSIQRGGNAPLTPRLDCVAANADGTFSAYFGYENHNGVTVTLPYGAQNSLALDTANHRVTEFQPGNHTFVFGVDFRREQQLVYRVAPDIGPTTNLTVTSKSKQCDAKVAAEVSCGNLCRGALSSGCATPSDAQCMANCMSNFSAFPECKAQIIAQNNCYGASQPGADHWICIDESVTPVSLDCTAQDNAFLSCLGF